MGSSRGRGHDGATQFKGQDAIGKPSDDIHVRCDNADKKVSSIGVGAGPGGYVAAIKRANWVWLWLEGESWGTCLI